MIHSQDLRDESFVRSREVCFKFSNNNISSVDPDLTVELQATDSRKLFHIYRSMAHQAHNLPWNTFASNFQYSNSRSYEYRASLVPRNKPQQGKNIEHFANMFTTTIKEFAATKRAQYTEDFEPLTDLREKVIDEETRKLVKKSTVYARDWSLRFRWDRCRERDDPEDSCRNCLNVLADCVWGNHTHSSTDGDGCEGIFDECELGYWVQAMERNCCFWEECCEINIQIKMLLLHGQMEPLLRLASHPQLQIENLYVFDFGFPQIRDGGWSGVLQTALEAYIVLNVLVLKPETWPSVESSSTNPKTEDAMDCRLTAVYQRMVRRCTAKRIYDVETLPHRAFFGNVISRVAHHPV